MVRKVKGVEPGMIFPTNGYGDVLVMEVKNAFEVRVIFMEYPYETVVHASNIRNGGIKNKMRPSVHGIGFIGVGPYRAWDGKKCTRAYSVWVDMLDRVYTPENELIAAWYKDTSVHSDWHNFQVFAEWYYRQINRFGSVPFRWNIDKDLMIPGNRVYSAETCVVVPASINMLMTDHSAGRGVYPMGVTSQTNGKSFKVVMTAYGQNKYLGTYSTIADAQLAYWNYKFEVIRNTTLANWQYLPEKLAIRLYNFGWEDAVAYYGDDARIWHGR